MIRRCLASCFLLICVAAMMLLTPSPALCHYPYEDDDSNYLKIVDYFAYPVAVLVEWTVARPLHALETRGAAGVEQERYVQIGTLRLKRGCASERPPRYCSRGSAAP